MFAVFTLSRLWAKTRSKLFNNSKQLVILRFQECFIMSISLATKKLLIATNLFSNCYSILISNIIRHRTRAEWHACKHMYTCRQPKCQRHTMCYIPFSKNFFSRSNSDKTFLSLLLASLSVTFLMSFYDILFEAHVLLKPKLFDFFMILNWLHVQNPQSSNM